MISAVPLLPTSFFFFLNLIIFIVCSLLYTSCLFSVFLNDNIVDIQTPDGICSPTFVVDEVQGLFLHSSFIFVKHLRSA